MGQVGADLRYTLRSFRQAPGFFSLVTGILALGIAFSVSVFSLADAVLLRPLPYRDSGRLVTLTSYAPRPPFDANGSLSYHDYQQLKSRGRSFEDVAITFRTGWSRVALTAGTEPVSVQGAFVSPNLFALFGRSPILGRTFTAEENLRAERVVLISEGLAAERFGSSKEALGQALEIGHTMWRVIGVMPTDFQVPFLDTQLWAPIFSHPGWRDTEESSPLERSRWDVIARLKPNASVAAAQAEVNAIEKALKAALPEFHSNSVRVVPLREHFTGAVRKPMLVLFSAVAFLFLIACTNVMNLLLARAADQQREVAIRRALGAGQIRLLRQFVTETVVLSVAACAIGASAAAALVPILRALAPADIPLLNTVSMNERSLVFALVISLFVGALLGVAPAWRARREDMTGALNAPGRSATESRAGRRLKSLLASAEFALAMVLLTAAGLLIQSFVAVLRVDPGFRAEHVLTVQLGLPDGISPPETARFYREVVHRIEVLPGVQAVGGASNLFFLDETRTHALRQVEGRPQEPKSAWTPLVWTPITGNYFQAMGIPLLRGRFFRESDRPDASPVVIVNETLARRYWPDEDPVGKRLKGFDPRGRNDDWLTVVGVVKDTRSGGLEKPPFSQIYELQWQGGAQIGNLVIRTAAEPSQLAPEVRAVIRNANRRAIISSVTTAEQLLERQTVQRRFQTWLITVFSILALALAALGVFAVMHYSVAARTNEMGIRMAVGANTADIVRLVLSNGVHVALTGIAIGAFAAAWANEAVRGMLYDVKATDPFSFGAAALLLLGVALAASCLPAYRASHIDPLTALRQN